MAGVGNIVRTEQGTGKMNSLLDLAQGTAPHTATCSTSSVTSPSHSTENRVADGGEMSGLASLHCLLPYMQGGGVKHTQTSVG